MNIWGISSFFYYKQCHWGHSFAAPLRHTTRNASGLCSCEEWLSQMHYAASPEKIMSIFPTCSYVFHTFPSMLSSSVFSTFPQYMNSASLVGMKCYLLVIWICISLISNEKEHFCLCLWAISYFLFSERFVLSFALFFPVCLSFSFWPWSAVGLYR